LQPKKPGSKKNSVDVKLNKDNIQASPMIVISDNESKQKQKRNVITQMASKNVG